MADGAKEANPAGWPPGALPTRPSEGSRALGILLAAALGAGALILAGVTIATFWPAPSLHGTVYDATDGSPLAGARVQVICMQPRFQVEALADSEGRYRIELPTRGAGASACANGTIAATMPSPDPDSDAASYVATVVDLSTQPIVGAMQEDLGLRQGRRIELRGRVTDAATGALVAGARMAAPFEDLAGSDRTVRNLTLASALDGRGDNYVLRLWHDIPEFVIVTLDARPGYPQQAKQVRITAQAVAGNEILHLDFALSNASSPMVLVEPGLVHLGNNVYTGAANSQFQLRANGTSRTWSVEVAGEQAQRGGVLRFLAKGLQMPLNVTFGNQSIGTMCCSPADGSFGWLQIDVPATALRPGPNRFTLSTGFTFEEHDDIELTQILLEFA